MKPVYSSPIRTIILLIISGTLLFSCSEPPAPFFLDSPPDPGPSPSSRACASYMNFPHQKLDVISAAQELELSSQFVDWLLELETLDSLSFQVLSTNSQAPSYALLLPTNDAIRTFSQTYDWNALSPKAKLALLKTHILLEHVTYEDLWDGLPMASSMNSTITQFSRDGEQCIVVDQQARFVEVEDLCKNGVIHVIDQVLIPKQGF